MIGFALQEGLRNVRRHRALSMVLAGSTGLVLLLAAFLLAIGQTVTARLADWERRVELVAFTEHGIGDSDIVRVRDALAALPGVAGVVYAAPEDSWRELIAEAGVAEDLVSAAEVALIPPAFTIQVRPGRVTVPQIEALAAECGAVPGVVEVQFAADLLARYGRLRGDVRGLMIVGLLLLMVLLSGLSVATLRLGLGSRYTELRSWVWEGADPALLTAVGAVEAGLQGLLGSAWAVCVYLGGESLARLQWPMAPPAHGPLFALLFVLGPGLSVVASYISTRRLLRALRVGAVVLLCAGLLPVVALADAERAPDKLPQTTAEFDSARVHADLLRLREQRERALAESGRLGGESRSLLDELEQIGIIEDTLHKHINQVNTKDAALAKGIGTLESRIGATSATHQRLGERAVRLSRMLEATPAHSWLDVLLADRPQGVTIRAQRVRTALLRHRLEVFGELERAQRDLRHQRQDLQLARAESAELGHTLRTNLEIQAAVRAERRALLHAIQSEQAVAAATVAELEHALNELDRLLTSLGMAATKDGGLFYGPVPFPEVRGVLPWPLEAGTVARRFGRHVAPVFLTVTQHDGWLLAPREAGAPVMAVHDGAVEYAGWLRGYGKLIVLDHGGGHRTLYGHCADLFVAPGRVVRAGEVIATVGTTGPLEGPALYFAVRVQGEAHDPAGWLARKEG